MRRRLLGLAVAAAATTLLTGCFATSDPDGGGPSGSASPTSTVPSPTGSPDAAVRAGLAELTSRLDEGWRAVGHYPLDDGTRVDFYLEMSTDVRAGVIQVDGDNLAFWGTADQTWATSTPQVWRQIAPELDEAAIDALGFHWTLVPAGHLADTITSVEGTLGRFTDIGSGAQWTRLGDVRGTPCWTVTTEAGRVWLPVDDPYVTYAILGDSSLSMTMDYGVSKDPRPTETVPWPGT